jgi:hypothetical protein
MIDIKPDPELGMVEVQVHGKLEATDFENLAPVVDEMIAEMGKIRGLVLNVQEFEGWDGIDALLKHLAFVKAHHQYVERVAAVGNKSWLKIVPKLASIFVQAEPRYFELADLDKARKWVSQSAATSRR